MNKKTRRGLIFGGVILVILWPFRAYLPFMFYNTSYIDVEFHVPESVTPDVGSYYWASNCSRLTFSDFSWIPSRRSYSPEIKQLSPTHYTVQIPRYDRSLCGWSIRSFSWSLEYKEPARLDPRVSYGGGAIISFDIAQREGLDRYLEGEVSLERQYRAEIVDFSKSQIRSFKDKPPMITLVDNRVKDRSIEHTLNTYDYNPYSGKPNKIILTATIDESQLHNPEQKQE